MIDSEIATLMKCVSFEFLLRLSLLNLGSPKYYWDFRGLQGA